MRHLVVLIVLLASITTSCADDQAGAPPPGLSTAAAEGYSIAEANGCFACHGPRGEGGPGPALVGLAGTNVVLDDGSTVTVDTGYLRRALTDPAAQKAPGASIVMPATTLDAAQVDAVVIWLEAVGR